MARLPEPGGDRGQWGEVLNEYLEVSHNPDGSIKDNSIATANLVDGSITVAKIASTGQPTSGQTLTYSGSQLSWTTPSASGSVPDASDDTKGLVQLAGDLGGTAASPTVPALTTKANITHGHVATDITSGMLASARLPLATNSAIGAIQLTGDLGGTAISPTVPGLAGKEPTVASGTTSQYYRGDKSWQTLNKAAVGLTNVDNTADADKPISSATQTALNTKASTSILATVATSGDYADLTNRPAIPVINDATSGAKGVIQLTGDLGGTATSPTVPGLAGKEPTVASGTTSQYYRGDKSWQTLDKAAVSLSNVDNTSDANKPVSSATQTALNGKANTSHAHSGADITSGIVAATYLPAASDTATGIVELATVAEVTTGTDTTRAVTAAGVKAAVDAAVATIPQVLFVDAIGDLPPGTPVDTLVVVRAA